MLKSIYEQSGCLMLCLLAPLLAPGGEVAFRRHSIDEESQFPACAAIDINQDGRLDIVSGGWWYQAPAWQRHKLRDVEMIRGRYDDYSNLPLDVNGDGSLDLVSVNYRSQSLYWVENPGAEGGQWQKHIIDTPGAMETGRLADVNGDGQSDVLPNGVQFAAWWELVEKGQKRPQWIRHDLPQEVAGHGIGFGDINGDGRGDVVGPRGWAEAPADPARARWRWHGDFRLHADASIPILVFDVDGDGDSDLFWGRGHNIGLYWMEQVQSQQGRRWQMHAVDTSCSGMHSLLLGDVDGDGHRDVIAGKRYMGHDGKDPGEYDPLVIAWYKFNPQLRAFQRYVISYGGGTGFGLDPKAVDLDEDGDLDLLCPGRSGLYYLENLHIGDPPAPAPTSPDGYHYPDHAQLMVYRDFGVDLQSVQSPSDWALRKSHILANMQVVMGHLPGPSRRVPLDVQVLESQKAEGYERRKITFAAEHGDRVPAYLLIPENLEGPAPALLCLHSTMDIGKGSPAGLGGPASRHVAHELAQRGYVCLAPDYPSFGDYAYDFQQDDDRYQSGSMKAIWNNIRAIDVLESLPEVNRDRIGCIGHSLGGHNGLFTGCFDQRLRAMITSCGFTAFHHYYGGDLKGWTSQRYMPLIQDVFGNDPDRMPFDFHEVLGCWAPRPVFINAPLRDSNFDVEGVRKVVAEAEGVYKLLGAEQQLKAVYPDAEHDFPDDVRQQAYQWLDEVLRR